MIYRNDLKTGPHPVPFGSLVTVKGGRMALGNHRDMIGVAVRPRWAVQESRYEPGQDARVLTDGGCLTLVDGVNTSYLNIRKGKIAS